MSDEPELRGMSLIDYQGDYWNWLLEIRDVTHAIGPGLGLTSSSASLAVTQLGTAAAAEFSVLVREMNRERVRGVESGPIKTSLTNALKNVERLCE
ncbi:hypothetical protein [Cryobacterium flavum]|nr:hypothetical protein [Cryobacterium flavum]